MEATKLTNNQIDLFIEEARPYVTAYRSRYGMEFIGGDREGELLQNIIADIEAHSDNLSMKRGDSTLHDAVTTAVRIYRAHDPYDDEDDCGIYDETRGLTTYVLGGTSCLEFLTAEHPGQYVWLVISALMAVAGVDNTVSRQAASGHETLDKAKAAGITGCTSGNIPGSIHAESKRIAELMSHYGALSRIKSVAKGIFYPEELALIRDGVKNLFPDFDDEAVRIFVIAAFAAACLDSSTGFADFEFVFNKKD